MGSADEDLLSRVPDYRTYLERLGREGRAEFVDMARRLEDWPEPQQAYLAGHARKWGLGRRGAEYAQWAFDIKNRAGVLVVAYVHPVKRNRGLAFVDLDADTIVLVDMDLNLNFDCISPANGTRRWLADKTSAGTHWRLRDTER